MKQRIFSLVIVLVVFVTSFAVVPVPVKAADDGLFDMVDAASSALYETIRKLGYTFVDIPFGEDSAFSEVMKPLVDKLIDDGLDIGSAFRKEGFKLYYNIGQVVEWVEHLFGSGDSVSFSPSSFYFSPSQYNSRVADFHNVHSYVPSDFGVAFNYPFFVTSDNIVAIPIFTAPSSSSPYYGYYGYTGFTCVCYYSVSGSSYTFELGSSALGDGLSLFNPYTSSWVRLNTSSPEVLRFLSYTDGSFYNRTYPFTYTVQSSSLEAAFQSLLNYVRPRLHSMTVVIRFNGVDYTVAPKSYSIQRPSAPSVAPSGDAPVNWNYVINNFNDATYIYDNDVIINEGVPSGSAIQVELVSPSAVHVIVDNMDDFSNESNNQIINNYDFDFGDLNIGGAIDDSAGHINDGLKDVATGSALGFLTGFAETVPADIRIMVFSFVAIALIAGVIGRVSGG